MPTPHPLQSPLDRSSCALSTAERALSHTAATRMAGTLAVMLLIAGCDGSPSGEGAPGVEGGASSAHQDGQPERDEFGIPLDAPVTPEARREIGLLIKQFRPLDPTLTSDHHDRWLADQRQRIDRVIAMGEDVGNAALHAYTDAAEEPYLVRRALIWTGGMAAPESARELLHNLFITYGHPIEDRTEAALVLARTSPRLFFSDARPILERTRVKRQTLPDDEFLVDGWIAACEAADESPVPMLAQVATNLLIEPTARWRAAKRLREFANEPIGQRALESCLIESSGDGYLRRMAAQSLRELLPRETACRLFEEVIRSESDLNFRRFLVDLVRRNCNGLLLDEEGLLREFGEPDPNGLETLRPEDLLPPEELGAAGGSDR